MGSQSRTDAPRSSSAPPLYCSRIEAKSSLGWASIELSRRFCLSYLVAEFLEPKK